MSDDFERALKATRDKECERDGACKYSSIVEQMCQYCRAERDRWIKKAEQDYPIDFEKVWGSITPPRNEHPV